MRLAEHHRELKREFEIHGIKPNVEQCGGNRVRYCWEVDGHPQCVVVSKMAGDVRATKNNIARIRRMIKSTHTTTAPPIASSHDDARVERLQERCAMLEDRVAHLEQDVALLLERLTAPPAAIDHHSEISEINVKAANGHAQVVEPPPVPKREPTPAPEPKRRGRPPADMQWLWRAMSYADWKDYKAIAAETGRTPSNMSVILTKLKKLGLVQHHHDLGWRKDRKLCNM